MALKSCLSFLTFLIVLLLFCFSIPHAFGQSQSVPFKHFPLPQDLPPILQMYEDHLGYIWLATAEGLYRFDGIHFIYYAGTNPNEGLGRETITHITEDRENNLWVGARSGLYKYNSSKNDFDKFSFGDEVYAYYIHHEKDSSFVVHTVKGIYLFYPSVNRWEKLDVDIPDQKIYEVLRGQQDDLWIGTDDILKKYDLKKRTVVDFKLPRSRVAERDEIISVNHLFLDSRQQLWINTWFKGVVKLNTLTGGFETFDTYSSMNQNALLGLFNPSMTEDSDGNIWMASYQSGISIYHHLTGTITHIPRGTDIRFGLVGNDFQIMTDRKKNIWVKSEIALHYLNAKSPVPFLKSDLRIPINDALFIKFLQPDFALIGTFFGLYSVNTKTKKVTDLNRAIELPATKNAELQTVSDVLPEHEDLLWISSPQGLRKVKSLVNKENDASFRLEKIYPPRTGFWASKLSAVNDSILMVKGRTNTNVLATFNKRTETFEYHAFADTFFINQAIHYKNDTLILCVRNQGLYKYHLRTKNMAFVSWNMKQGDIPIRKPVFLNIQPLQNGTYALCTENFGLVLYDPKDNSFDHIDVAPISNTNIVYAVNEDTEHNLWIQTSNQLLYYDIKTEALAQTTLSNSFKGDNPSYFIHTNNDLYCTFEGGLYQIEYATLFRKTEKPKLYLQKIKAGSQALDWLNTNPLRLSYSDNFLSFEYIGLDYDNPQGIRYWYKIPEIRDEWILLDNQTSLSIGRVASGRYNLSLKASNDAGIWSEVVYAPEIIISPPFWKSWWFITSILVLLASLTAYLIRIGKTRRETEMRLRNQIARDLHDDIGSTLSGIKIFSTIAHSMSGDNKDLFSLLQQIRDKSDAMMQSMSDIVWSINPAHDSLHDMIIRLKQFMAEVLESQDIELVFETHTDLKGYKIGLGHRKELYLTLKEIINNAAKHSKCKTVTFTISRQKNELVFVIADDGMGFEENEITYGNGLKNIEARIREIGGRVIRDSLPGKGTKYEIRVPV